MQKLNKKEIFSILGIALRLFLVCTIIAALVGAVNHITKDIIAEHELEKTTAALDSVYKTQSVIDSGVSVDYSKVETELSNSVTGIYKVTIDGKFEGHGVLCEPNGFKDVIKMMVAFDKENTIIAVRVISLSETVGIGDKVKNDPSFAEQFAGKQNSIVVGTDIKAISGATVSSKAVTKGVNDAISLIKVYTANSASGEEA